MVVVADAFVLLLLAITAILVCLLLPFLLFVGFVTLLSGRIDIFLLFFGPTIIIPGCLAALSLHLLEKKFFTTAYLAAFLSFGSEVFAFAVALKIK